MLVPQKLTNIYQQWKLILDLVIEDEGGDGLIESKWGKLYSNPSAEEAETLEDVEAIVAGGDDYEMNEDEAEQEEINEADSFFV